MSLVTVTASRASALLARTRHPPSIHRSHLSSISISTRNPPPLLTPLASTLNPESSPMAPFLTAFALTALTLATLLSQPESTLSLSLPESPPPSPPSPNSSSTFTFAFASILPRLLSPSQASCAAAPPFAPQPLSRHPKGNDSTNNNSNNNKENTTPPSPAPNANANEPQQYKASVKALKGLRPYMEDEFLVAGGSRFVGVFDGHGGAKVSAYLRANIYQTFIKNLEKETKIKDQPTKEEVINSLKNCVLQSDEVVQKTRSWTYQGSTCVICYIYTCPLSNKTSIISVNIGDSRAVLSRNRRALDLTLDHKPNDPFEKQRILELGGTVKWYGFTDKKGNPIEGSGVYRINDNLAVARAIGDKSEKPYVTSLPDVKEFELDVEKDEFIILGSDGLWDVMSSQETVNFVNSVMSGSVGALLEGDDNAGSAATRKADLTSSDWAMKNKSDRDIVREAIVKRKKRMGGYVAEEAMRRGSSDNICVVVVWLREGAGV